MKQNDDRLNDVCGVILAGGQSSRMGCDKATLEVGGIPMFHIILRTMRSLFNHVIIAGDRPDLSQPDIPCFPDQYPGSALGGLYTGLAEAKTEWIFVSACDMPFPDEKIVRRLLALRKDADVVVPKTHGGFEPLFAVYRKTCLPFMKEQLTNNRFKIDRFYPKVCVRYVSVPDLPEGWERSLINVNTPEEFGSLLETSQ